MPKRRKKTAIAPPERVGPWIMHMRWSQLLFMHWPIAPRFLKPLLPEGLELDTYEGQGWIGVVPFLMSDVRPRLFPPMGPLSRFLELNVRTYVRHRGQRGVWFFSLDAASKLAVRGARLAWHLPYYDAAMSMEVPKQRVHYQSRRTHDGAPPAGLKMSYSPTGSVFQARAGSVEDFLTHRLSLFSANSDGDIYRGDIDHPPWPLQPAEAEIEVNTMTEQISLELPETRPLLHYAERLDVRAWMIRPG